MNIIQLYNTDGAEAALFSYETNQHVNSSSDAVEIIEEACADCVDEDDFWEAIEEQLAEKGIQRVYVQDSAYTDAI